MNLTMAEAKRDFERGLLKGAELEYYIFGGGWRIKISTNIDFEESGYLVDARSAEPRILKTADSALSALVQIGFKVTGLKCSF